MCSFTLYSLQEVVVYILVYEDDIIITGIDSSMAYNFITQLNSIFSPKVLGELDYFIGIEVKSQKDAL